MGRADREEAARVAEQVSPTTEDEEPALLPSGDDDEPVAERDDTEELARERDELLDMLRRVQADFENFRKRTLREQTDRIERATEHLIEQLLPVLDSFELALVSTGDESGTEKLRKGVELVFAELLATLEKSGLRRIESDGAMFDPAEHEAVMQIEGEIEGEPVVAETVRTGYRLKDRVLRPAMVKVAHG